MDEGIATDRSEATPPRRETGAAPDTAGLPPHHFSPAAGPPRADFAAAGLPPHDQPPATSGPPRHDLAPDPASLTAPDLRPDTTGLAPRDLAPNSVASGELAQDAAGLAPHSLAPDSAGLPRDKLPPDSAAPDRADRRGRGLPRGVQWLLVMAGLAVVLLVFLAGPAMRQVLGLERPAMPSTETTAPDAGAFQVSDRQWASLKIETVHSRPFQDIAATDGKIAIDDDLVTPVFSPYTGRVTRLIARAGDSVQRGDPLFAVQATELAQAQNDLITAASALRTARAQLFLSETNEKRQHALYQAQGAALKDWQQSQVDLATAQGGFNTAQIALAAVRSRLRILGKTDADIDAIERAPDPLKLDADTMVRSPIGGTVVQRQVGLRQNIISASSGASTPVFMIGDLSKVWLVANAREEDAPLLHAGDPVEVHLIAFPSRVFHARLAYVGTSIDATTHRLPVRAEVDNPDRMLKPEMFATFRIMTGAGADSPAVPERAVVYEGDAAHVWVANAKAKTLEIRAIRIGHVDDGMVQVLDGLHPGEAVVTSGAVFIDRAVSGDAGDSD